jgi:CheY-like chemotaxis protein
VPRVLLVDDDIAEISAVKRVLSRAGHQPVLATNAADALAALARSPPALLLVAATCENGDAVRRFAEAKEARGIPMVVLGECASAPEATPRLPRPIDPDQLATEIAGALAAGPAAPARRANGAAAPPPSRKAAADALRARADELRRGGTPAPPPPQAVEPDLSRADAALAELEEPAAPPGAGVDLDLDHDPGLEAILRRAEEAERAHAAERKARARQADRATVEARQRAEAEQLAVEKAARARAAEERARAGERARAEEQARAASERRAREEAEARARQEAERREAEAEARRRAEEEARRAEEEARRAAEEARRTEAEARREGLERARAEREARAGLEDELERLRRQAGEETRRREAEEEELRSAIASARAEMEELRRRGEEEARRRADAEAEVARLAREAERKLAEASGRPAPFDFPAYRPPAADPAPDPAQEAARRRVAAARATPSAPAAEDPPAEESRPSLTRAPPPELRAGTLADAPAPRLLALAARAEVTGRLDFEGDAARSLYLEGGRIVGATSSDPAERVEELALRLGLVTRDQYRLVAGALAALPTRRAAVVLLERGFLKPAELTGLVRRHTEEVAFGTFGDAGASFRWAAAEVPPDERTTLERTTLQLAVEGVRRRWLEPQCEAVLGGDATLLAPVAGGPSPAELALSAEERRAVALADGLRTLDEILAASPLDPLSTRQALAALVLVGALAVRTFQGGRPAAAATAAIDLARVRDKLDQVRRADYFTILGVGRLCTPHEVREAFERLRAELDPRRFQGVREEGLAARLDEIQRVLADARDVLADDRLRGEYLRGLGE